VLLIQLKSIYTKNDCDLDDGSSITSGGGDNNDAGGRNKYRTRTLENDVGKLTTMIREEINIGWENVRQHREDDNNKVR
jgi:hypothetical protein